MVAGVGVLVGTGVGVLVGTGVGVSLGIGVGVLVGTGVGVSLGIGVGVLVGGTDVGVGPDEEQWTTVPFFPTAKTSFENAWTPIR